MTDAGKDYARLWSDEHGRYIYEPLASPAPALKLPSVDRLAIIIADAPTYRQAARDILSLFQGGSDDTSKEDGR